MSSLTLGILGFIGGMIFLFMMSKQKEKKQAVTVVYSEKSIINDTVEKKKKIKLSQSIENILFGNIFSDVTLSRYKDSVSEQDYELGILSLRVYFLIILNKRIFNRVEITEMSDGIADELWHNFILDTKSYEKFCLENFGEMIHHIPYAEKKELGAQYFVQVKQDILSAISNLTYSQNFFIQEFVYKKEEISDKFDLDDDEKVAALLKRFFEQNKNFDNEYSLFTIFKSTYSIIHSANEIKKREAEFFESFRGLNAKKSTNNSRSGNEGISSSNSSVASASVVASCSSSSSSSKKSSCGGGGGCGSSCGSSCGGGCGGG